jgi:hypothetical protein
MKQKIFRVSLGLIFTVTIVGCNSDNNTSSDKGGASATYNVTAIDGYLNGAEVWLDLNNNFLLDPNEPSAISGAGGIATLDVTGVDDPSLYPVVVRAIVGQTVDETEGDVTEPFVMSAPAGETAVTPLTTIVHNTMKKDPSLTKDEAVQQLASDLGIESDDVLGDFITGDGKPKAAYAAEQIVSMGALPETADELAKAADQTSTESSKFELIVTAVNQDIKEILDTVPDSQTVEEIKQDLATIPPPAAPIDSDGDGIPDSIDAFDQDPTEWVDNDQDNLGDNEDDPYLNDSDNDSYSNDVDLFPNDASEWFDDDNDGLGDNEDDPYLNDSDNDSYANDVDRFPNDSTEWEDNDNDGLGDNEDDQSPNDTDNDTIANDTDNCTSVANQDQADFDRDGLGDVCDDNLDLTWSVTNWNDATWQ